MAQIAATVHALEQRLEAYRHATQTEVAALQSTATAAAAAKAHHEREVAVKPAEEHPPPQGHNLGVAMDADAGRQANCLIALT